MSAASPISCTRRVSGRRETAGLMQMPWSRGRKSRPVPRMMNTHDARMAWRGESSLQHERVFDQSPAAASVPAPEEIHTEEVGMTSTDLSLEKSESAGKATVDRRDFI